MRVRADILWRQMSAYTADTASYVSSGPRGVHRIEDAIAYGNARSEMRPRSDPSPCRLPVRGRSPLVLGSRGLASDVRTLATDRWAKS